MDEHEGLFQRAYENLETRVAAEFESYIHGPLPLPLGTIVSVSCWVQEPLTQNVQVTHKTIVLKEVIADYDISNNTFTILTQVRQQQESLEEHLASKFPCEHHALFHVDTIGAGPRSDDGTGGGHFQVRVRLGRSRTQSR